MDYYSEYKNKLISADTAAELVRDGDLVGYSEQTLYPEFWTELYLRKSMIGKM